MICFSLPRKTLKASKKKVFATISLIGPFNRGSDLERRVCISVCGETQGLTRHKQVEVYAYLTISAILPYINTYHTFSIFHFQISPLSQPPCFYGVPRTVLAPVHRSSAPQRYVAPIPYNSQPFRYNPAYSVGLPTAMQGRKLPVLP